MGIRLSTGKTFNISLGDVANVYVLEAEDLLFRHDSAVMLPEAYEGDESEIKSPGQERITGLDVIRPAFLRAKEYPLQKLLIAGHTDTTGRDSYNISLSDKRGHSVLHIMLGNREDWAEISDKQHVNKDIQHILTWVFSEYPAMDCDPEGIDGIIGSKTRSATKRFQRNFETVFGRKIGVDGVVGPETWGAFFDVYQRKLAAMLDSEESELPDFRNALHWADSSRKAVGCGESWPIEAAEQDKYRSRINRRVELLFFDEHEVPPLDCHAQPGTCDKTLCRLYGQENYKRVYLPVHPHPHAQSTPTIMVPERPGSTTYVRLHSVHVYVAYYEGESLDSPHTRQYLAIDGKLCDPGSRAPVSMDCDREAYFYCSHRDDLMTTDVANRFKKDRTGLPLVGPLMVPCGQNVQMQVDMWAQTDWAVIDGVPVDGVRPDGVLMADWSEAYSIGYVGVNADGETVWSTYYDQRQKMSQESWRGGPPIELVNFSTDASSPLWIGTVSLLPTGKSKALMVHSPPDGPRHVTSFNELRATGANHLLKSHHTYDKNLVARLAALPPKNITPSQVDAFNDPPPRYLLPGDICWHDQGSTNYCGAYSFAAAMNYWRPYTCNPVGKNGAYWHEQVSYLLIPYGARTPSQIEDAAANNNMFGRDNNAESLANDTHFAKAMKLIALWIQAGVPVVILVEESYSTFSLHWKVIVGRDGNRMFILNSGGNDEYQMSKRQPGVNYDTAPVGNDVDSFNQLYAKWDSAGGGIVDAFSSVDGCTFIPIYPKDSAFASDVAR